MTRIPAVFALLALCGSPALALADIPPGPSPRPHVDDQPERVPEPPAPTPATPPPATDTPPPAPPAVAPPEVIAAPKPAEQADAPADPAADNEAPAASAKTDEAKPKDKEKSGSCAVAEPGSALLGFAVFALLGSGLALRRRED